MNLWHAPLKAEAVELFWRHLAGVGDTQHALIQLKDIKRTWEASIPYKRRSAGLSWSLQALQRHANLSSFQRI